MSQKEEQHIEEQTNGVQSKLYHWNRRTVLRAGIGIAATTVVGAGALLENRMGTSRAVNLTVPSSTIVVQWVNVTLQAVRDARPALAPSVVARLLSIVSTCMYDAWAAYTPTAVGTRLGGTLRHYEAGHEYHHQKTTAISFAAYRALVDLVPSQASAFQAVMQQLGYNFNDVSTDASTPVGIGNIAAKAVLDFRHHDGSNQLGDLHPLPYSDYTGYVPVNTSDTINNPNRWQPLSLLDGNGGFVIQKFATPQWGRVKPFALTTGSQLRPSTGPAHFHTREYV